VSRYRLANDIGFTPIKNRCAFVS